MWYATGMRVLVGAIVAVSLGGIARAQPGEPAPPADDPAPPPADDPALAEQVAALLVQRALELAAADALPEARQLAAEALAKSPSGPAADQARALIQSIDERLGAAQAQPPVDPTPPSLTPIGPTSARPDRPDQPEPPDASDGAATWAARVHAGMYAGLLGATAGALADPDAPAVGAVVVGLGGAAAGGYFLPQAIDKLGWSAAQIRTVGLGITWGGVAGGVIADLARIGGTRATHVLAGASIGATVGGAGGVLLARGDRYTRGDVALADTLAGIGAAGGLALGMLMQPAEREAYALNAALGAAAGLAVGLVAAPRTNTTERRMVRVAGLAAAGGAVPFLLYAGIYSRTTASDERLVGALATAGLAGGAWLGFHLTRDLDAGQDVRNPDGIADAPPAVVARHSDGRWAAGTLAIQPLSPVLAPQPGLAVPLVGAAF